MLPDVSVIIPAYNTRSHIEECVTSVLGQTLDRERLEIIAVDDGSTDGTDQVLDRLAASNPELRVVHQENTGGPSIPRNVGLDLASGRYVFFLDSDDRLGPEALARMVTVADEQGTDVVLGKMVGRGGRHAPRSMFTHNQPRTDVFESRIYWTLNPMKLFRRELIERLGLRFMPGMSPQEDQPFVATAYFNASGVSVIADYDCVYWTQREEGNLSDSADLESQLRIHRVMLPLIRENTEPGAERDHLVQRHLEMGLLSGVRDLGEETDPTRRAEALEEIGAWVDEFYCDEIGDRLQPIHRICYELVRKRRPDLVTQVFVAHRGGARDDLFVEDGRAFARYPFFRDAELGVPDRCYEMTDRVRTFTHLSKASWTGGVLSLEGFAHLLGIVPSDVAVAIALRHRATDIQYRVPARVESGTAPSGHASARFGGSIDVATAADGRPLADGIWDVRVEVVSQGITTEVRLGSTRADDIDAGTSTRFVPGVDGRTLLAHSYHTRGFGNLSLGIGEQLNDVAVRVDADVRWAPDAPAVVLVAGSVNALDVPRGAVRLHIQDAERSYDLPADLTERAADTAFTARLDVKRAADGRAMPDGTWSVTVELEVGNVLRTGRVPNGSGLRTIRWWRGLRPMHAKSVRGAEETLALRIKPVRLVAALGRRLRRLIPSR